MVELLRLVWGASLDRRRGCDVLGLQVVMVRDRGLPDSISYGEAVVQEDGIGRGGAAGEPAAGFEDREHDEVVVEEPVVICCQVVGADQVAGEPSHVLASGDVVFGHGESPSGVIGVGHGHHACPPDEASGLGGVADEGEPGLEPDEVVVLTGEKEMDGPDSSGVR